MKMFDRSRSQLTLHDPSTRFFEEVHQHRVIADEGKLPLEPRHQTDQDSRDVGTERMARLVDERELLTTLHGQDSADAHARHSNARSS